MTKACPDCGLALADHFQGGQWCGHCQKRWFEHAGLLIDADTSDRISRDGP